MRCGGVRWRVVACSGVRWRGLSRTWDSVCQDLTLSVVCHPFPFAFLHCYIFRDLTTTTWRRLSRIRRRWGTKCSRGRSTPRLSQQR